MNERSDDNPKDILIVKLAAIGHADPRYRLLVSTAKARVRSGFPGILPPCTARLDGPLAAALAACRRPPDRAGRSRPTPTWRPG